MMRTMLLNLLVILVFSKVNKLIIDEMVLFARLKLMR